MRRDASTVGRAAVWWGRQAAFTRKDENVRLRSGRLSGADLLVCLLLLVLVRNAIHAEGRELGKLSGIGLLSCAAAANRRPGSASLWP